MTADVSKFDAIIVGGGHNGLVAAFYLAKAGKRVLILESRESVGGPAATVEFFPGYRGAMTNSPGSLEPRIIADMELERFGLRWLRPDPAVIMPFPDGRFFVGWRDQKKVQELIARDFSAKDAEAYPQVFEFFNKFAKLLGVSVFGKAPTLPEIVSRLKTPQDQADFATIFFGSMKDFVEKRFESEAMRAVVGILGTGGAVAPSMPGVPAAMLNRPIALYSTTARSADDPRRQPLRGSTGIPVGGMGAIIAAMQRSLERLGVVIRTNSSVKEIVLGGDGAVKGVALEDGSEFAAPLVISNLHPVKTLLDLVEPGHLPPEIEDRLKALPVGAGAFKLVLAVDEPPLFEGAPPDLQLAYSSCQIRYAPSLQYLEKCHQDYIAGQLTDSPRLAGLIPTFNDPSLAPEGKHLLSINSWFYPIKLAGTTWDEQRDIMGKRILSILTQCIPSLARSVIAMKCYSPADLEREYGLVGGNFSHLEMVPAHMFALRPISGMADYRTPVPGLYLCGSGTWPGGTVTGIPGHNAAHAVLDDLAEAATPVRRTMTEEVGTQ